MKDRNRTNCFPDFRSFLNVFEEFARNECYTPEIVASHSVCFIRKDNITLDKTRIQKWSREATNY